MIKILLLIDYSSEFDRKLLRGLVHYSKDHGPWIFYRLPYYYALMHGKQGVFEWARKWKADAVVGQCSPETVQLLMQLHIPVVVQNYHHRNTTCSNLTGAYKETGQMAAQFFIQRRFRHFAYFGVKGVVWSDERAEGFRKEVERHGGWYANFMTNGRDEQVREEVHKWLNELPKPVALFCCDDVNALKISEICRISGIAIPDEIALMGVDNDELMCTISDPTITSIELEVEKGGYAIGRLIHNQLLTQKITKHNIVIHPTRIVQRQSTEKLNIRDPYVYKVVKWMEENYDSDLSIEKLLAGIPLSRRNFEVKFRNEMGTSIYQYLLNCRCSHLADLLVTTNRSVMDLAMEVGFQDCNNISRIFKKYMGETPTEYRRKMKNTL